MRNAWTAAPAALALLSACASAGGGAGSRGVSNDAFRPCPGQDAAMARIAGRPQTRRPDPGPLEIRITRTQTVPAGQRPTPPRLDLQAELELLVNAEGRVTAVRVLRSTGDFDVDNQLMGGVRNFRFDPETEWAFPVPGCALFAFHLRG